MVAVFGKPISEVTLEDVRRLVEARVPEGRSLDYKAELYDATPKGLREFAGDVAAFANTDGGLLRVWGVGATARRRPDRQPEAIVGMTGFTPGAFARYEQSLGSTLAPRLTESNSLCWALRRPFGAVGQCPAELGAPHMVTAEALTRFYYRTGTGRAVMDVDQIRMAFRSTRASTNGQRFP